MPKATISDSERCQSDLNQRSGSCSPTPYHLAMAPYVARCLQSRQSPRYTASAHHISHNIVGCHPGEGRQAILMRERPWTTRNSFMITDSDGNRTRVTAVKGRCLNRLTTEPYTGYESGYGFFKLGCASHTASLSSPSWARTNNPTVNSRVLYH